MFVNTEATTVTVKDPPDVLDRQKCLDALAALRHAKWFQVRYYFYTTLQPYDIIGFCLNSSECVLVNNRGMNDQSFMFEL